MISSVSRSWALKRRSLGIQPSSRCSGGSTDSGLSVKRSTWVSRSRRRSSVGALLQPEDDPQDDLERHALQPRVQRDGLVGRPRGHLALGQLGHQPGEALHPLAVKGRQQQAALLQVIVLVEQDHRVAPDQRLEDARALAGVQHVGRGREHLLDVGRVPQHHERRLERQPHGDPLAVAVAGAPATPRAASTSAIICTAVGTDGPGGNCALSLRLMPASSLGVGTASQMR